MKFKQLLNYIKIFIKDLEQFIINKAENFNLTYDLMHVKGYDFNRFFIYKGETKADYVIKDITILEFKELLKNKNHRPLGYRFFVYNLHNKERHREDFYYECSINKKLEEFLYKNDESN